MPFTDPVSSVSGRNSRASNVSAATGVSRSQHRSPPASTTDTLASAGVLSMLKTSTDTGDIGALSFNTSRLPGMPGAARTRRGLHNSRPSASAHPHITSLSSNHSYAPSQTSRISSQWDNASTTQRRGSLTSMQSMPPSLPPLHTGKPSMHMMQPNAEGNPRDSRSYSMTSAPQVGHLPRHRSATSLKSQGHEPRHGNRMPPGPVPPMPENRPPFVYPTRLKRPGFRSPSPALSDTYGPGLPPGAPPMPRRAPGPHPPPMTAYNGYNVAYAPDYNPHLNVRPPARTANSSPGPGYGPNQFAYQQGQMRQQPGMPMPYHMQQPYQAQQQMSQMPQVSPQMPSRSPYGPQYPPQQSNYAPYNAMPLRQGYRGPPPPSNIGPMAHQMFHNAARMARHLPHRTDTPLTDAGPPSSDGPSSSAPDSSSPPTPKDHTTIQVVVDPAFIDPALVDLQDSSSEPVLPNAKYFEYADGLDRPMDDAEMEVPHPSVPPSGFVQRVKAMLESKAAAEAAVQHENERNMQLQLQNHAQQYLSELDIDHEHEEVSEIVDVHEMAANETPRFTIIEEFEAPAELPASPVKVAELDATETSQGQTTRITRDMVRAELEASSLENTLQQAQPDDSTAHVLAQLVNRGDESQVERVELPTEDLRQALVVHSRKASQQTTASARSGKHRQDSVPEAITEMSIETSLSTGVGYALRFSGPQDTTVGSSSGDETQSKDPFALDADTITMQQQSSAAKEGTRPYTFGDRQQTPAVDIARQSVFHDMTPVSPLRPGEVVKRSSAVSPVQDDNRGIDETLRCGLDETRDTTALQGQSAIDSLAADSPPPPTPRTPKTYSKSVQIRPSMTADNSTISNRFSLPGDLSTVGDTTLNSGSDMVTDVAVRFSLPGTTITVGKPQIIDVSTSSTPDKPTFDPLVSHTPQPANLKAGRRHSVTFAEGIAPLNINKKSEPSRGAENGQPSKGKSIMRQRDDTVDFTATKSSHDYTAELQNATGNAGPSTHVRYGSAHLPGLPGLKEESIEDMSSPEQRRQAKNDFPLPSRIAAVKAMQERRLQESADKAKARRAARKHNRPLGDTKDLPSLNFSRTDLFEKLNEALEVRPTKSMDVVRRRDFSAIHCPSPQRPMSTEPLRERYTSFFSKPDEFSFLDEPPVSDDDEDVEPEAQLESIDCKALIPVVQIQENTQVDEDEPGNRPLSPEDFLNVASQVSRLSIPSVAGLSERISELIPGLRNLSNLQLDNLLSSGDMHPGYPGSESGRPDTLMTDRTSAGFRTLAERAEEIVVNGTHDSIAPVITAMALDKELPPLPGSTSSDQFAGVNSMDGKASYLSGSVSMPTDLGKDPTRPISALLRTKVPTTEEEVRDLLPKEMNPITRMANRRSMILSQPSSRPWNVDQNYPWSGNKIEIDLSVPSPAHTRKSCASELLRERRTRSLDLPNTSSADDTKGIDIGSITTSRHGSRDSVNTEQLTGFTPQHYRKPSKRSIIGSITRKFGLSPRCNAAADEDATTKSLPNKSPVPRQTSAMSHKPGDRYPTSSLTPPAIAALDEVRSFFSDNSSERDRTASFRKRLTNFKGKGKTPRAVTDPQFRSHSLDEGGTEYNAGSIIEARAGSESAAHAYEGVGMSKTEFHIKRFGEKLRIFFAKSGDLFRSWSTRGRPTRRTNGQQDEWLADSVYSGV